MLSYCQEQGLTVPPGLSNKLPSRFAIVRKDGPAPKFVALTFSSVKDALGYLKHSPPEKEDCDPFDVLDFETRKQYRWDPQELLDAMMTVGRDRGPSKVHTIHILYV